MYQVEKAEKGNIILHLTVRTVALLRSQVALFWQVQRPELRFYYHLFIIDSTHCCSFDVISCLARTSSKASIKTQNADHGNLNLAQSTINSSYILAMRYFVCKYSARWIDCTHTSGRLQSWLNFEVGNSLMWVFFWVMSAIKSDHITMQMMDRGEWWQAFRG